MLFNQDEVSANSMMVLNQLAKDGLLCHHGSTALSTGHKRIRGLEQIHRSMAISSSQLQSCGYLSSHT